MPPSSRSSDPGARALEDEADHGGIRFGACDERAAGEGLLEGHL
ncbi:hypothetical protein [Nonomuraea diastatica]|nr:hypothetical protein [Nonomuraea diastatica]